MRLRKIKNANEKLEEYGSIMVFDHLERAGKWGEVFGNANPIILEIGMGKGQFISENAIRHPENNYLGFEIAESIVLKAARKLGKLHLGNLRIIHADAHDAERIFAPGEIAEIFLNFSDPWPKSRHAKRRLTFDNFLVAYENILKRPGIIELKTDNRHLFEYSLLRFNERRYRFLDLNLNLHEVPDENIITTEYEDKFVAAGNTIYYVKVEI